MNTHGTSLTVLIAEDEMMIGMALEDALTEAGYTIAGLFATCSTALEWLNKHRVDAAVIDFILRDGNSVELLRELKTRGVPILLHSGLDEVPAEFRELPFVIKPTALDQVINALDKLMLWKDKAASGEHPPSPGV